jgi:hypothetical protein
MAVVNHVWKEIVMIVELGKASVETKGWTNGSVMFDRADKPFPSYLFGSY